jgi:hypothetical protein
MEACLAQGCAWGARAVTYEGSVFPNGGEDAGKAPIDLVVRDAR